MNVEKTIEFILQQQARTEVVLARITERQDRAEKSMNGIRGILKTGMRMLVRLESNVNRLEGKIEQLSEAQKQTDKNLDRLIKSLQGPHRNGGSAPKR